MTRVRWLPLVLVLGCGHAEPQQAGPARVEAEAGPKVGENVTLPRRMVVASGYDSPETLRQSRMFHGDDWETAAGRQLDAHRLGDLYSGYTVKVLEVGSDWVKVAPLRDNFDQAIEDAKHGSARYVNPWWKPEYWP